MDTHINILFEELNSLVDAELRSVIASRDMTDFYSIMSYHLGSADRNGQSKPQERRIRIYGSICLLTCHILKGSIDKVLPAAAAMELVNNFCQIHEDVQGGRPQRDHQDAIWWIWGPAQAINAGDAMHALARLSLINLGNKDVSFDVLFRSLNILDAACLETCEGRFFDLEAQENLNMEIETYISMASKKTGSLVSSAMQLGALLATSDEHIASIMGNCGNELGIAMQIRQDINELRLSDDASPLELMNKKKLLPVVYAFSKGSIREKRQLGDIYFKRVLEKEDIAKLRILIDTLEAEKDCVDLISHYRGNILEALNSANLDSEQKSDFTKLIDLITD